LDYPVIVGTCVGLNLVVANCHLHLLGVGLQKLAWILRPGVRVSSFKLGKKKLNTVISWYTVLHQKFDGLSKLIFG
jgi:hypothetical protein